MRSHWKYTIRGSVQGVGMRYMVSRKSRELGLLGSVRNMPDGAVEIHVAGSRMALMVFDAWLRTNPGSALVSSIKKEKVPGRADVNFKIIAE